MNFINSPIGDSADEEESTFSAPVVVVLLCIWSLLAIAVVWLVAFLLS